MKRRGEDILLFLAALAEPEDRELQNAAEITRSGPDWNYLAERAAMLDVAAGLTELLSRVGGAPDCISAQLREAAASEFARTEMMQSCYRRIASLLDGHDIRFIPLKGCDARIARGPRRLVNPMEDIDILVQREDLARVRDILVREGFLFLGAQSGAHLNFALDAKPPRFLEIHWDLINRENPCQARLFHPDLSRIWKECIILCDQLHVSHEDLLCYTVAHAFKEYFRKPKWPADALYLFRHCLPGMHPGKVARVVEEWGVGPALGILAETLMIVTGDRRFGEVYPAGAQRPGFLGKLASDGLFRWDRARLFRPVTCLAGAGTLRERIALISDAKDRVVKKYFT